jgi:DNA-binding transcriptional ArsR family regulator
MVTKVTTDEVYSALCSFGELASSTEIACKLGISSSTVKAHLGKLRDADKVFMTKKEFGSQIKWGIGKGDGQRVVKFRSDMGKSHNFELHKPGRRPGTLADVPPKQFWWSTTL